MRLQNAVALITGAASGIGLEVARRLVGRGARVALIDMDERVMDVGSELETAPPGTEDWPRTFASVCDVRDTANLERVFADVKQTFGRVDIVCNNAGIASEDDAVKTIDINLLAVIRGTYLGIDAVSSNDTNENGVRGCIINVSSMAGLLPLPIAPVYTATKFGVVGFTRAFEDYGLTRGIRVNCICPSFTDTPLVHSKEELKPLLTSPLLDASLVAAGVLQLIEDDTRCGSVMRVTPQRGIDFFDPKL